MKSWKKLDVWQKTHALVLRVYEVTARFPAAERYRAEAQTRTKQEHSPAETQGMTEKKPWIIDNDTLSASAGEKA